MPRIELRGLVAARRLWLMSLASLAAADLLTFSYGEPPHLFTPFSGESERFASPPSS